MQRYAFCFLLLFSRADAQEFKPEHLVERIESLYSKSESLKSRFEIETINESIGEAETERGELWVSRPDKMKWLYREPEGKLLLLDGRYQWMYLPDEKQAFRGKQDDAASDLTLTLLADPGTLQSRFSLRWADSFEGQNPSLLYLRLDPKQPTEEFKFLILGVEADTGKMLLLHVVDAFEHTTKIRFSDLEFNPRLSSKIFEIDLPRKTEILDFQGEPVRD